MAARVDARLAELVERACLAQFEALPPTGKPNADEWTIVAAVLLLPEHDDGQQPQARVVSLATGTKCMTQSAADADTAGWRLRDGHAEVCARRAFRRFLIEQLRSATVGESSVLEPTGGAGVAPWRLRRGLRACIFTSACPCGCAAAPAEAGSEPGARLGDSFETWPQAPSPKRNRRAMGDVSEAVHRPTSPPPPPSGVRRKPGRGEHTRSMSCSDKVARWAVLGLQGALLTHLLEPVRPAALVVAGRCDASAVERACWRGTACTPAPASPPPSPYAAAENMAVMVRRASTGPPVADAADELEARWSAHRVALDAAAPPGRTASTNSVNWCASDARDRPTEAVNGVRGLRLGAGKRKLTDAHRSRISKLAYLRQFADLCVSLQRSTGLPSSLAATFGPEPQWAYGRLKRAARAYQDAKRALLEEPSGPLAGWAVSPAGLEDFGIPNPLAQCAPPPQAVVSHAAPAPADAADDGAAPHALSLP